MVVSGVKGVTGATCTLPHPHRGGDLWWVGCGASINVASRQDGMGMALWDSAS